MKDKWMNIGYEEDELKPYNEPLPDLQDNVRIGKFFLLQLLYLFKLKFLISEKSGLGINNI